MYPSLSFQERLIGFACCCGFGVLISLGSFFRFSRLLAGHPTAFALCFSLGCFLSLMSTMFLTGPFKQIKNMAKPKRAIASIIYVLSIAATITLCCVDDFRARKLCILLALIMEFFAMVWYVFTYIPFGQRMLKGCLNQVCCV